MNLKVDTTLLVQNSYKQHNDSTLTARLNLVNMHDKHLCTTNHKSQLATNHDENVFSTDCVAFELCNHKWMSHSIKGES